MKKILLIHGPNLNKLGQRDPAQYGPVTLDDIEVLVRDEAKKHGYGVGTFQSNHEGALINFLQEKASEAAGVVINPGALAHYSYALHDALVDTGLPCVEVHLSHIHEREAWRRVSVTAPACIGQVMGKKEEGYVEAVQLLKEQLTINN